MSGDGCQRVREHSEWKKGSILENTRDIKRLGKEAPKFGGRVLKSPKNKIAIGFTIGHIKIDGPEQIGKQIIYRNISGMRV